jgi:hypothetical protein
MRFILYGIIASLAALFLAPLLPKWGEAISKKFKEWRGEEIDEREKDEEDK